MSGFLKKSYNQAMSEEIEFEKYRKRGAYHWTSYFGSLLKVDCFLRGRYDMVIQLLKRSGATANASVLEIGCGDGALSGLIYKIFKCDLTGLEPSAEGIQFCKEMFQRHGYKGKFERSEGYALNCPDDSYDFIILADVIEHLQHPDLMLKEMKRIVKPGGSVIITTPVRTSEHPEDKMHVHEFYPDELIALCKEYFSELVHTAYSHPVIWYELYTFGKKRNRSLIRLYCRIKDKILGRNVFLKNQSNSHWKNFKQQALLLKK